MSCENVDITQSSKSDNPEFSAIVTCYYEEKSIEEFHKRLKDALESIGRSYEIIMVNDGSMDNTWSKLSSIFEADVNVRVIMNLFKNSGQAAAVTAGINEAKGKAIILMDSDLQLSPEDLPLLVAEYDKGYDLVTGYRKDRRDSLMRIIPSKLANVIMRKASRSNLRDFGCTFKIYRNILIQGFEFGPFHLFSNVEIISRINRIQEIAVSHHPRRYGNSGWTFSKLWRYNMDNIVLMLERPFQYIAAICAVASLLFILRISFSFMGNFTILNDVTNGLLLNAIALSLLIITSILSIVGEFSVRNFSRLQKIPYYIVRDKLRK